METPLSRACANTATPARDAQASPAWPAGHNPAAPVIKGTQSQAVTQLPLGSAPSPSLLFLKSNFPKGSPKSQACPCSRCGLGERQSKRSIFPLMGEPLKAVQPSDPGLAPHPSLVPLASNICFPEQRVFCSFCFLWDF